MKSLSTQVKKLSKKQREYRRLRIEGYPPQESHKLAGYRGLAKKSAPYQVEAAIRRHFITREDLLACGSETAKKILEDFLDNKPGANAAAALKIIRMQQDRIDPVVKRIQVSTPGITVSVNFQAQVERDFEALMNSKVFT